MVRCSTNELLVVCQAGLEPALPKVNPGVQPVELLATLRPTDRTRARGTFGADREAEPDTPPDDRPKKHAGKASNLHLTDLESAALPIELPARNLENRKLHRLESNQQSSA